ncbi:ribosome-associated translation inhibitor RaiA [bacterium]|nr:ribosome-associated translation inhibitor RaiA [bacterium]
MKIRILGTKIDLTTELKDYIQEKMDMLEKYLGDIEATNCDVEVALIKGRVKHGEIYKAEVNLELPGSLLRVKKEEESLYKAIDKVKDHLVRSIKRYKEKK